MSRPHYQLTRHPVGSISEIWNVSWPLIVGLMSASVMLFVDRLLLSRYSVDSLNAATSSGTAAYAVILLFMAIAAISEVFVGRFHGESRLTELGKPVWQMIWFSILTTPFFLAAGFFLPPLIFQGSPLYHEESSYFWMLMVYSPLFCLNVALAGFFVGSGKMKVVTLFCLIANVLNVLLDFILIFGAGPIPPLGIKGAAIATGTAEAVNILGLSLLFFRRDMREKYGTAPQPVDLPLMLQCINVGLPSAILLTVEVAAHFSFFKILSFSGALEWTVASMVQSFYFLIMFLIDGLSRGVSTVSANLLGAKEPNYIPKVLRAAVTLQVLFSALLLLFVCLFSDTIVDLFFNERDETLLSNTHFLTMAGNCFLLMSLFFLFFGISRILTGHLTAALDTRFLMKAGVGLIAGAYILPVFGIVVFMQGGVEQAYLALLLYSIICLITYSIRYKSKFGVALQRRHEVHRQAP
ncbi:MATE family efflux transporter [Estrella lausannensis]|uniref:Putative membrane protein n=1 Tax=Estrella lausannensis TaxID=483423 RepID=A0A0H5DRG1_9BACT|nr:MATE family efflux transporter [Estrella lausannensis]CRX39172.1 putative membrane protein [Estrella lausannensis]